ncbi:hypothetical protein ACPCTN_31925 [Streptomyces cinereoruber]|uniref:hypothetical protein n=1 Tax=Streptomyces cinereoruber TaxID=67260 RepID=UPI003C2DA93A
MSETTARPAAAQLGIPRQTTAPSEGRAQAEQLAGTPTDWELKKDRGSTTVWRVTGPTGQWALKIGRDEDAAVVAREAEVLRRIATVPPTSYGTHSKSGRASGSAWLLTPWLAGPSTWDAFRAVRDGSLDRSQALAAAVDLATAVGALHQSGWVHGDVQPHHAIHAPGGVRLVGCSWAWHMSLPPSYASHGGLLYLMPPELIRRVEDEQRLIAPSQRDETYTLAASLWWAATNSWPLDYSQLGIDPARFTGKGLREVLVRRWPPLGRIAAWPQLEEVLRAVLTARPNERPSALHLAQWLRSLPS